VERVRRTKRLEDVGFLLGGALEMGADVDGQGGVVLHGDAGAHAEELVAAMEGYLVGEAPLRGD
jgi:hypothetical protein